MKIVVAGLIGGLVSIFGLSSASAQQSPSPQDRRAAIEAEQTAAFQAAQKAAKLGPTDLPLIDQGMLRLPPGYAFVPKEEAARVMRSLGNTVGPSFLGTIFPTMGNADWFANIGFVKAGYVKDEEAKDWNADELLTSLREGTEAGNADRLARGFAEIEVKGWVEKPAYDAATHRLVWSASVVDKGARSDDGSVNYNTYALGREGYFSLNLISSAKAIAADKPHAHGLLAALSFDLGKRYSDFNSSTDRVAEYGIAALVAGAAAKKLGLFALIGVFFLKFAKIIVPVGLAALYGIFRLFRRNKGENAA